jgi:hypothetical protein
VNVRPPRGAVFAKAVSVDFFHEVVAVSAVAGESISIALSVTGAIGSLY